MCSWVSKWNSRSRVIIASCWATSCCWNWPSGRCCNWSARRWSWRRIGVSRSWSAICGCRCSISRCCNWPICSCEGHRTRGRCSWRACCRYRSQRWQSEWYRWGWVIISCHNFLGNDCRPRRGVNSCSDWSWSCRISWFRG